MVTGALPRLSILAPLLVLAACGDPSTDYPALLPTERMLAEPVIPGHAGIAASSPDQVVADLRAEGAALAVSQAQVTAADVTDDAGLAARAKALQARAAALGADRPACADPAAPTC